jgi:hypothetical protein
VAGTASAPQRDLASNIRPTVRGVNSSKDAIFLQLFGERARVDGVWGNISELLNEGMNAWN